MHQPHEEYDGPAEVHSLTGDLTGEGAVAVRVRLRGRFEPIDGHFHWYGRIAAAPDLDARHRPGDQVLLRTPLGQATGRLSDPDTWGRLRVGGIGSPPF